MFEEELERRTEGMTEQGRTVYKLGAEYGYDKGRNEAREIIQRLIANAPNTYSGTNIELQQKKMFSFQDAVNKAEQFLKETE